MDGSNLSDRTVGEFLHLDRPDALFRVVYFGEALRAVTEYVSDTLITGPHGPIMSLLDDAFDRMSIARPSFGPEEFSLFVMSLLAGLSDDEHDTKQLRLGAAQYILSVAAKLPAEYEEIVAEARQLLATPQVDARENPREAPAKATETTQALRSRLAPREVTRSARSEARKARRTSLDGSVAYAERRMDTAASRQRPDAAQSAMPEPGLASVLLTAACVGGAFVIYLVFGQEPLDLPTRDAMQIELLDTSR